MAGPRVTGLTVIVAGLLAAFLFRAGTKSEVEAGEDESAPTTAKEAEVQTVSTVPDPQREQRVDVPAQPREVPQVSDATEVPPARQIQPPAIAQNYQPAFPVPKQPQQPTKPVIPVPATKPARKDIEHAIRNGDTLRTIAQKYYGRPDMANYLFQHNRDILQHPDLLPLKGVIKVPAEPHSGGQNVSPNSTAGQVVPVPPPAAATRLSPVRPEGEPRTPAPTPRAQNPSGQRPSSNAVTGGSIGSGVIPPGMAPRRTLYPPAALGQQPAGSVPQSRGPGIAVPPIGPAPRPVAQPMQAPPTARPYGGYPAPVQRPTYPPTRVNPPISPGFAPTSVPPAGYRPPPFGGGP